MAEKFESIVKAINHCHQVGIIHRDIKSDNIMLGLDGNIKVIDFGFATDNSSMGNEVFGTKTFLAPEVFRCLSDVKDHYVGYGIASDMWSLGVTLYFMLTGRHPTYMARSETTNESYQKIKEEIFKKSRKYLNLSSEA